MTRGAWSICASMLILQACLEPNPNAVGMSTADGTGTDTSTTDADTTETTGPLDCPSIADPDQCAATEGCQTVEGSRLDEHGPGSPCLEASQFIGCIPTQVCDQAVTWFCQGNNAYQVADTCGPEGFAACDGPADPVDACP